MGDQDKGDLEEAGERTLATTDSRSRRRGVGEENQRGEHADGFVKEKCVETRENKLRKGDTGDHRVREHGYLYGDLGGDGNSSVVGDRDGCRSLVGDRDSGVGSSCVSHVGDALSLAGDRDADSVLERDSVLAGESRIGDRSHTEDSLLSGDQDDVLSGDKNSTLRGFRSAPAGERKRSDALDTEEQEERDNNVKDIGDEDKENGTGVKVERLELDQLEDDDSQVNIA
jgi:hypothetical protein